MGQDLERTVGCIRRRLQLPELYVKDFFPHDYPDVDVLVTASRHGLRLREFASAMQPGLRESRLHGGFRTFYYVYKMLLSMWAASGNGKRP